MLREKLPRAGQQGQVGGGAKPGALTRSAVPPVRPGDPSRQALSSAPGRGGPKHCLQEPSFPEKTGPVGRRAGGPSASGIRLVPTSRAAQTQSRRDHQLKPLVTHHLASAARTTAAGSASTKAAARSGSCRGTLRMPTGTKSLFTGVALPGLLWVGCRYSLPAKCESCEYLTWKKKLSRSYSSIANN